jgi:DNA-binding GntR family transcriptional regulator
MRSAQGVDAAPAAVAGGRSSPRTSEEHVFNQLKHMIISGELPSGEFLSQRMLGQRLNAAVVTVRSALRSLESHGLIENVPKWGVRIPVETANTIRDRYFLREVLEAAAARRVVELNNATHARQLMKWAIELDSIAHEDPENIERFAEMHYHYHHFFAECAQSAELVKSLDRLSIRTRMLWNAKRGWARGHDQTGNFHTKLTEAVLHATPDEAAELMREHIRRGLAHELEAIKSEAPDHGE